VSDLACREMDERSGSLLGRFAGLLRRTRRDRSRPAPDPVPDMVVSTLVEPVVTPISADVETGPLHKWQKHPVLRTPPREDTPDPEDPARSARAAAARGILLARGGRLDDARAAFAEAAGEPSIDLADFPGFWDLTRGGMQAAVDAYGDAGRLRDAARLAAMIRLKYRPRAMADLPVAPRSQVQ